MDNIIKAHYGLSTKQKMNKFLTASQYKGKTTPMQNILREVKDDIVNCTPSPTVAYKTQNKGFSGEVS